MEGVVFEYVVDREELRLILLDYAGIGINRCFAVGECVQSVYCLVRGNVVRKVDYDFNLFGCHVLNLLDLDLPLVLGFQDRIDEDMGSLSEWYFRDCNSVLVDFLDACAHLDLPSALAGVVFRAVG